MLLDREKREVCEVEESIMQVFTIFREEAERLTNFRLAMRTLAGKKSETELRGQSDSFGRCYDPCPQDPLQSWTC